MVVSRAAVETVDLRMRSLQPEMLYQQGGCRWRAAKLFEDLAGRADDMPFQTFSRRRTAETSGRDRRHRMCQARSTATKSWVYKTVLRTIEVIV
jgi:hypothetical protein